MNKLIEFIRSIYVVLLFLVLEGVALGYYAHATLYTQAKLLARSHSVVGGVQGALAQAGHYFSLGRENRLLAGRVAALEQELAYYRALREDSLHHAYAAGPNPGKYRFTTARVRSNTINRSHNFLLLDRGKQDGVVRDMAVLSPDGAMAGYVVEVTDRYAVAVSILNTSFRASGKLAGDDYFGSIYWDGSDRYRVRMNELSKYADIHEGAEVVSTGFSQFFPADVLIGWVERFTLNETRTSYEAEIRLAADISALADVILVHNQELEEVRKTESNVQRRYRR